MRRIFGSARWACKAWPGDGSTAFGKVALPITKSALDFGHFARIALGLRAGLKAFYLF